MQFGILDILSVSEGFLFKHHIDYFIIVFKPFNFLYKLSGIIMTFTIAVGYAICIMNIAFLAESDCKSTNYWKVGNANTVIFLIFGSFAIVFAHTLAWLPCCKRVFNRKHFEI